MSEVNENIYSPPKSDLEATAPTKKRISRVWVGLAVFFLVGTYGNILIPAAAGMAPPPDAFFACIFWHIVAFSIIWKWRLKNPWIGGALGGILGTAIPLLAAFLSGFARGI